MTKETTKKNRGFVILFAVTLSAILLAIALGVANIALKEVKFGTSARDTNDAFFAADTGTEQALYNDKLGNYSGTSTWSFVISGLGSGGLSCANVSIDKTAPPIVTIISKGYNIASSDGLCSSTNTNRVERELKTTYGN
jgi:Tfp pilus assembly protein PilX